MISVPSCDRISCKRKIFGWRLHELDVSIIAPYSVYFLVFCLMVFIFWVFLEAYFSYWQLQMLSRGMQNWPSVFLGITFLQIIKGTFRRLHQCVFFLFFFSFFSLDYENHWISMLETQNQVYACIVIVLLFELIKAIIPSSFCWLILRYKT